MKFGRLQWTATLIEWGRSSFRWWRQRSEVAFCRVKEIPLTECRPRRGPWLADWRQVYWVPVYESVYPAAQRLILAAWRHEMLPLRYWGGSTPGRQRCISPGVVFQVNGRGPMYVAAYCHLRRAERVFRVDRVEFVAEKDLILCITE